LIHLFTKVVTNVSFVVFPVHHLPALIELRHFLFILSTISFEMFLFGLKYTEPPSKRDFLSIWFQF